MFIIFCLSIQFIALQYLFYDRIASVVELSLTALFIICEIKFEDSKGEKTEKENGNKTSEI